MALTLKTLPFPLEIEGIDHLGQPVTTSVVTERPLTLYLNSQEVVTMMTIGDQPDLLALGYLVNQNMLKMGDEVTGVDYDEDLGVVVVRTGHKTNFEEKMKKVRTSGCAQGTIFGDVIDAFAMIKLSSTTKLKTSWLYALTKVINTEPSLYLKAGAIHGCVLCEADRVLVYMEDVGRHNAAGQGCRMDVPQQGRSFEQDVLYNWPPDLGNGDQDSDDGHSNSGIAFGFHRLGSGTGPPGKPDPYWQGPGQTLCRPRRS